MDSVGAGRVDCNFVLASNAEVERVWSLAKLALGDTRHSLTPEMFEVIVFLKYNYSHVTDDQKLKSIRMGSAHERYEEEKMSYWMNFISLI